MNKIENDEADDKDAVYVQPNVDLELDKDKRQACREIVLEIKNFGVSQRQILYLIRLLALELENVDAMKAISQAVGSVRKDIPAGNKIITPDIAKKPAKKTLLR